MCNAELTCWEFSESVLWETGADDAGVMYSVAECPPSTANRFNAASLQNKKSIQSSGAKNRKKLCECRHI